MQKLQKKYPRTLAVIVAIQCNRLIEKSYYAYAAG